MNFVHNIVSWLATFALGYLVLCIFGLASMFVAAALSPLVATVSVSTVLGSTLVIIGALSFVRFVYLNEVLVQGAKRHDS